MPVRRSTGKLGKDQGDGIMNSHGFFGNSDVEPEEEKQEKFECEGLAEYIIQRKKDGMPVYKKEIRKILGMKEFDRPVNPEYSYMSEYPIECALHYIASCRLNGEVVNVHRLKVWAL